MAGAVIDVQTRITLWTMLTMLPISAASFNTQITAMDFPITTSDAASRGDGIIQWLNPTELLSHYRMAFPSQMPSILSCKYRVCLSDYTLWLLCAYNEFTESITPRNSAESRLQHESPHLNGSTNRYSASVAINLGC